MNYFRVTILSLFIMNISNSSLLVIKDSNGKTLKKNKLSHKENLYLSQKDTEWNLQAIYNELYADIIKARKLQEAKDRLVRIQKEIKKAKEKGLKYKLNPIDKAKLLEDAKYYRGGKYIWGGTTPQGFDCSGYVQYLYKKHNVILPRTAYSQSKIGQNVQLKNLKKGDLVFFLTDKSRGIPITHVGIYIGDGNFIHAASKKLGIMVSPITYGSYRKNFVVAKRVIKQMNNNL